MAAISALIALNAALTFLLYTQHIEEVNENGKLVCKRPPGQRKA